MPGSNGFRRLLRLYLAPQWRQALLLLVLMLAGVALELASPQIIRRFIDSALAGQPLDALLVIGAVFLAIALLTQLALVAEQYLAGNVAWRATNRLRADLTLHCLTLDLSYHGAHPPGELVERVDGDVAKLSEFFSQFLVRLAGNVLLLLGILLLSYGIEWRVGLALTLFASGALVVLVSLRQIGARDWEAQSRASAGLFGFLEEYLSGTEDLRANGATPFALRRLAEQQRTVLRTTQRAVLRGYVPWSATGILLAIGTAIGLLLGMYLYRIGTLTIGSVYLIFAYTELLRRPMEEIGRQVQQLQQASASVARIGELLAVQSRISDGDGRELPDGALPIAFEGVTFGYADEGRTTNDQAPNFADNDPSSFVLGHSSSVLTDVSFRLEPGQVLGLLGRTGSGKTTLARLIFRLYDPQEGRITLGGYDLRALRQSQLRRRIGLVTQDIQLFHASVRDNLTFFDPVIADERIIAVLDELGLGRWFHALPEGLNTRLAPDGGGLSAGQAQLLAFARVFLHNPGLVILDEASSRLDPATERAVEQAVERLLRGRTAIIIAHRLPTVQRADKVLILERGQIVEFGLRRELADDADSRFAQLLRTGMEEALV
jgi:ABC-type multidrug transport system fused ATPase/permease subunit